MVRVYALARGERIATLFKVVFSCYLAMLSVRRDFLGKVLQRKATLRLLNRPRLWNKSPLFREKLHRFQENLPRFRENLLRFWENLPRFSSPLLRIELHFFWRRKKSWISGVSDSMCWSEEALYDWHLQNYFVFSAAVFVGSQKKIPLIAGWMGFFIVQRSADYRIKDAIKRCLRANRKE